MSLAKQDFPEKNYYFISAMNRLNNRTNFLCFLRNHASFLDLHQIKIMSKINAAFWASMKFQNQSPSTKCAQLERASWVTLFKHRFMPRGFFVLVRLSKPIAVSSLHSMVKWVQKKLLMLFINFSVHQNYVFFHLVCS